jgi:hypothetical protein
MARTQKIMVIRHGEKPGDPTTATGVDENGKPDPQSLTAQGWRRAKALAGLFHPVPPVTPRSGLAVPQHLFAAEISDVESSKRPVETLTPLSLSFKPHLPIDASIKASHVDKICEIVAKAGEVVLVAWKHELIPAIAQGLTSDPVPDKWPKERFDVVWVFDLRADGSYGFSQVPELLLPGDLKQTIPLEQMSP